MACALTRSRSSSWDSFTYANDGVETHVAALVASEDEPRPFEVDAATVEG
jgi:hypothetical protein